MESLVFTRKREPNPPPLFCESGLRDVPTPRCPPTVEREVVYGMLVYMLSLIIVYTDAITPHA